MVALISGETIEMLIRAASEAFERDQQGVADAVEVSWALPFGLYADAPTIDALLHTCALHRSVTWYFPDYDLTGDGGGGAHSAARSAH